MPPCDPNLSQPLGNHRSLTSRVASAAGWLRSDGQTGSYRSSVGLVPINARAFIGTSPADERQLPLFPTERSQRTAYTPRDVSERRVTHRYFYTSVPLTTE